MTEKEYLQQYRALDAEINAKSERVMQLKAQAVSMSADIGAAGSGGRGPSDRLGGIVVRYIELENEINRDINRLLALQRDVDRTINDVENPIYKAVLRYRYINGWGFERIAEAMAYSRRQILRLHGKALGSVSIRCP